jgi:hypothetical protein
VLNNVLNFTAEKGKRVKAEEEMNIVVDAAHKPNLELI